MITQIEFKLPPMKRGFHLITHIIEDSIGNLPEKGILNLFVKHTSAGLTINENADPSVRVDFESSMNNIVPENMSYYTHTYEGNDDMPAHVKSSLVGCSINIPITNYSINLGTWQGIYLCEFRNHAGGRRIVASIYH